MISDGGMVNGVATTPVMARTALVCRPTVDAMLAGMRWLALCVSTVLAAPAGPLATPGELPVRVEVGKTAEREVGIAHGMRCDDLSVVRPELVTVADKRNVFRLTGLKEGQTECRVGLDPPGHGRPTYLFAVTVVAARRR